MVNYQNAKIYKIVNDELNLTYYGSTCSTLTRRLSSHKTNSSRCSSKILFTTETKAEIFLVEKVPCNDKEELHQRERFYIENNDCINKVIPNRKPKESRKACDLKHIEKRKIYNKEYREQNKEKMKEYRLEYAEKLSQNFNCDCGGKYRFTDKGRHYKTKKHQNFINSF